MVGTSSSADPRVPDPRCSASGLQPQRIPDQLHSPAPKFRFAVGPPAWNQPSVVWAVDQRRTGQSSLITMEIGAIGANPIAF